MTPAPAWITHLKAATACLQTTSSTTLWHNVAGYALRHLQEIGESPSTETLAAWSWLPHHAVPLSLLLNTVTVALNNTGTSQSLQAYLAQAVGSVAVDQRWDMEHVPPDLQRLWFHAIEHSVLNVDRASDERMGYLQNLCRSHPACWDAALDNLDRFHAPNIVWLEPLWNNPPHEPGRECIANLAALHQSPSRSSHRARQLQTKFPDWYDRTMKAIALCADINGPFELDTIQWAQRTREIEIFLMPLEAPPTMDIPIF